MGIPPRNIFKKWKKITAQNPAFKSPRSTINPPQTHHEFTIKKHHTFANPPSKSPQKTRKTIPEKNHKNESAADKKPMPQERILVVDDEESVRGLLAALLARSGYSAT
ncbi:MAG TPA: response regulator, partial [Edaphobacter sp.]|nr:response regulator [Edaphobacter sp.]